MPKEMKDQKCRPFSQESKCFPVSHPTDLDIIGPLKYFKTADFIITARFYGLLALLVSAHYQKAK